MGGPDSHQTRDLTCVSHFKQLPPELLALVDFLVADRRPTAVLQLHADNEEEVLFENEAFKSLRLRSCCIGRVLKDADGRPLAVEDEEPHDVRSWRASAVLGTYTTLTYDGKLEAADISCTCKTDQSSNGLNGHGDETADHDPYDWTRYPVSGLSDWNEHVRTLDWSKTGVGKMENWSDLLRSCVLHICSHPNARLIVWGESRTVIYNEACIELFGERHARALGKPVSEAWEELWSELRGLIDESFNGKTLKMDRLPLCTQRHGFAEETYWDFVTLPIIGARGNVFGQFLELQESTRSVVGERRRSSILNVRRHLESVETLPELWSAALRALETAVEDVPFAFMYAADQPSPDSSGASPTLAKPSTVAKLVGTVGFSANSPEIPPTLDIEAQAAQLEADANIRQKCDEAWKTRSPIVLRQEDGSLPEYLTVSIAGRAFSDKIRTAVICPITSLGGKDDVLGLLILGLNPRRPFDDEYKIFTHFLSDFLMRAASLISLPLEQRRAQKISDDMNNALANQLRIITLQAERQEAKFSRMAAEAPTGVFVFDTEGHPLYVNDAFLRTLGSTRDQHLMRQPNAVTWEEHIHPDDLARFQQAWQDIVEKKLPFTIEHRLSKPWTSVDKASSQQITGETWLLANAFPEFGPDGKITSIQGWLTDISFRKFTESLVSRKLEEALENKRQTENFIDMTSHEMRNPLSAILQSADAIVSTLEPANLDGAAPIALSSEVVTDITEAAETIILCAQHQKRIVDDILTLSKLDASLLVISPDRVQAPPLLHKAVRMFESEMARAQIQASVEVEPTFDELKVDWVVLDPSRLLQVVINLLTNAIKFVQDAERREIIIHLGASYEKPTGKHHSVNFIPTKHQPRAESPLDDWGDGEILYLQIAVTDTGRGLSEEDMQSLFQRFKQASPKTYQQYGGSGLGLFISRELCELQGGQIGVSSSNGKTTFTFFVRAKRWVPTPGDCESPRPALPRFTSTSNSPMTFSRRGSVVPRTSSLKFDELRRASLMKEDPDAFAVALQPLSRTSTLQMSIPEHVDDDGKLHILVVEDNLINQKVMSQQLRRAGCVVHVANHGLECLSFIEKTTYCKAQTQLSVVLLDLEMPTMDGLTCIKVIRERQKSGEIKGHVPVVCVTANARNEQIDMAINAGMDQVVTKPFFVKELLPQMHALVEEVTNRAEPG